MRVLVVGGTRFIGFASVERLLERGHELTVYNRGTRSNLWPGRVRELRGDRADPCALAVLGEETFDAIVDFCAYDAADARTLLDVQGSVERLVQISSGTVYRLGAPLPWREETPYGPAELWGGYARGKIACEQLLRAERPAGAATTVLRFPWVLGPRSYADRERFVLNRLLDRAELLLPGDGQALQQFLSVDQAAQAIVAATEAFASGGWRAFNVASPGSASLEGFVRVCGAVAGVEPIIRRLGAGPTGLGRKTFDITNCVFPFPNENYVLDLRSSEQAGIAPEELPLEAMIESSLGELCGDRARRRWQRTEAERVALRRLSLR